MLAGPHLGRLLNEFEDPCLENQDSHHHEQSMSAQITFQKQVNSLCSTIQEMGNPFLDDSKELLRLDTGDVLDDKVVQTMATLEDTGQKQYQEYNENVIDNKTTKINDTIKHNKLYLYKTPMKKTQNKDKQLKAVESDSALFGQLYISIQTREGDLQEFFKHETKLYPPSISEYGDIYFGKKSDLLSCLEMFTQREDQPSTTTANVAEAKIFDGAAVVHMITPKAQRTFDDYTNEVFIPFLQQQLHNCTRVDVVWDKYEEHSLKVFTRNKRGKGTRRKVLGNNKLPRNWLDFLREEKNKMELFTYLSLKVKEHAFPDGKAVYITSGNRILS